MTVCWWRWCAGEAGKDGLCPAHHAKDLRLRRTYGITLKQAGEILTAQDWCCPVGGEDLAPDNWVVDHDHVARKVRGILCAYHNHRVIGRHRDWLILYRAYKYLAYPPADAILGEEPTVPKKKRKKRKAAPKK
jgi:hypothetical protein